MNTVKVAVLRNETDRLFALANNHYHACVGMSEVESWVESARRALKDCEQLACKRASAYDLEQFADAKLALSRRIAESASRLQQPEPQPRRPRLSILSPSEDYGRSDRIH